MSDLFVTNRNSFSRKGKIGAKFVRKQVVIISSVSQVLLLFRKLISAENIMFNFHTIYIFTTHSFIVKSKHQRIQCQCQIHGCFQWWFVCQQKEIKINITFQDKLQHHKINDVPGFMLLAKWNLSTCQPWNLLRVAAAAENGEIWNIFHVLAHQMGAGGILEIFHFTLPLPPPPPLGHNGGSSETYFMFLL